MKILIKLVVWFVFGLVGIGTLLLTTDIQTPWQYTVHSTVGAGSAITVSQQASEEEIKPLLHAETPLPLSAQKTVDVGAPAFLIIAFLFGSILTYGLKGRRTFTRNLGG